MPNVFGIIGNGEVTEANASALLDNYLPEGDIHGIYTTERVTRGQKGLRAALGWMEAENLEIDRVGDVLANLEIHLGKKHEPVLIVIGTEGVEEDINAAHELGIQVVDLAAALDDVLPEEESESAEDVPALPKVAVADPVSLLDLEEVAVLKLFVRFIKSLNSTEGARKVEDPPFDPPYVDKSKAAATKAPAKPAARTTREEGTKPFFVTDDGGCRPARGRKAADETKVFLNETEAAAYMEANGELPF